MVYMLFVLPVMVGFCMFAVDYGRLQLAKTQRQTAADAAARYAVAGMAATSDKDAIALANASAVVSQFPIDTGYATCTSSNVTVGMWTSSTKSFAPTSNISNMNAVKVSLTFTPGAAGSAPMFCSILGRSPITVHASSIAMASVNSTTITAPSTGNLWLSGMPYNTTITNLQGDTTRYDNSGTSTVPKQRPKEIDLDALGISPGDTITFEGVVGQASNGGGNNIVTGADGQTDYIVSLGAAPSGGLPSTSVNGIANTRAPLSAFMAMFMNDNAPNTTSAPTGLDFGTTASRNYTSLSPVLKQPFFVGDGKTDYNEVQYIKVPAGATRMFLGMMDAWQWNDNSGSFTINVYKSTTVSTVK